MSHSPAQAHCERQMPRNGRGRLHRTSHVQLSGPIDFGAQADLESGRILFVHDGANAPTAGFDTVVSDAEGATSGKLKHVNVSVRD